MDRDRVPRLVKEFPMPDGHFTVSTDPKYTKFLDKFSTYQSSFDVLYNKFHTLGKRLHKEMNQVSATIQSLSECCKHISTVYKLGHSHAFSDMYKDIEASLLNWSDSVKLESKSCQELFQNTYKYWTKESQSLTELCTFSTNIQK